jgi:hypothetical protein
MMLHFQLQSHERGLWNADEKVKSEMGEVKVPGFEAVFAITGLLAVA